MSYIEDSWEKYRDEENKKPNPYWYGLLKGNDVDFLMGYDWNTFSALNNFFDNLDIYEKELADVGIYVNDIDPEIVNGADDTYNENLPNTKDPREVKWFPDYTEQELSNMSKSTRIMLLFKFILNHYVSMQRDELVTSMIDNMDEGEYAEIHDEVFGK